MYWMVSPLQVHCKEFGSFSASLPFFTNVEYWLLTYKNNISYYFHTTNAKAVTKYYGIASYLGGVINFVGAIRKYANGPCRNSVINSSIVDCHIPIRIWISEETTRFPLITVDRCLKLQQRYIIFHVWIWIWSIKRRKYVPKSGSHNQHFWHHRR